MRYQCEMDKREVMRNRVVDKGRKIFGRLKRHWKDDIVLATGSTMNKDSRGQRKKEDSGRRLLPAVEKHSLKQ